MKTKNNIKKKEKTPISIVLIIIWMGYMAFRVLSKLINLKRFELNSQLLGESMARFNYIMDAIILVAFIILIVFFILRKRNSWKYFIYLIAILIIGHIIGLFYIDKLKILLPLDSPEAENFVVTFTYIITFLLILFHSFLIYIVYKKRNYFLNYNANSNQQRK